MGVFLRSASYRRLTALLDYKLTLPEKVFHPLQQLVWAYGLVSVILGLKAKTSAGGNVGLFTFLGEAGHD